MGFFDDIVNTVTSVSTEAVKFTVQTAQEVGNVAVQSAVSASEAVVKVATSVANVPFTIVANAVEKDL